MYIEERLDTMKQYKDKLMSKNGKVIISLAREMLTYYLDDRIKTIKEYSESYNTARGTIQSALKFLQEIKAVKLESRGHLGTYIVDVDYDKLWSVSDFNVIMGVMPLPYSKRYEGLATGFYKNFETRNIPFSLAFMRGSSKRIEALTLGRYNFAITSKLAARLEMRKTSNIEIAYEFGEESYVGRHVIVLRDKDKFEIEENMRVAIDTESIDQIILTSNECKDIDIEYIETPYNQILNKMNNNEIDAAIWNVDEIKEKNLEYNIVPMTNKEDSTKDDTIAVVVIRKDDKDFSNILNRFIDLYKVEQIQKKVMKDELIPIY
ncbi:GntR family transcriptional regulator YhfZ [Senegalia massiliensis]|nr:GntR family transcriptional regulator YhfZ [Senegalia massiliensis]